MIKILKKEKNKKTFYKIGTLILLFCCNFRKCVFFIYLENNEQTTNKVNLQF